MTVAFAATRVGVGGAAVGCLGGDCGNFAVGCGVDMFMGADVGATGGLPAGAAGDFAVGTAGGPVVGSAGSKGGDVGTGFELSPPVPGTSGGRFPGTLPPPPAATGVGSDTCWVGWGSTPPPPMASTGGVASATGAVACATAAVAVGGRASVGCESPPAAAVGAIVGREGCEF